MLKNSHSIKLIGYKIRKNTESNKLRLLFYAAILSVFLSRTKYSYLETGQKGITEKKMKEKREHIRQKDGHY